MLASHGSIAMPDKQALKPSWRTLKLNKKTHLAMHGKDGTTDAKRCESMFHWQKPCACEEELG